MHTFSYNEICISFELFFSTPSQLHFMKKNLLFYSIMQEIVKELIHQKLAELQSTQALIKWTLLRESSVNRHRTSNNRACICEMLEDHVNKTYGPVVIQV